MRNHWLVALAGIALSGGAIPTPARAQFPPDSFANLQVLPKAIPQRDLLAVMRGFSFALGVSCQHCHVGRPDAPLDSVDFVSDAKRTKRTARNMLRMVNAINTEYLAALGARPVPPIEVRCVTCHRGLARPEQIQDVLARELDRGGPDSAVARYRALRQEHYGSAAYDFSVETLNEVGAGLLRQRRFGHAAALLALGAELHPGSMTAHFYLGEARRALGDTAGALASYRRALELEPGRAFIQRLIDQLAPKPRSP